MWSWLWWRLCCLVGSLDRVQNNAFLKKFKCSLVFDCILLALLAATLFPPFERCAMSHPIHHHKDSFIHSWKRSANYWEARTRLARTPELQAGRHVVQSTVGRNTL
jgi:hypothetical protein